MTPLSRRLATAAALVVAAAAGYWGGHVGHPLPLNPRWSGMAQPTGPVIYYNDPNGRPFYSLTPRNTDDGKPYVAVHASEDVERRSQAGNARRRPAGRSSTTATPWAFPTSRRCRRRTRWGWTTSPSTRATRTTAIRSRSRPAGCSAAASRPSWSARNRSRKSSRRRASSRSMRRRLSVVAMRFDGFINKVMPVTSGTHVRKGDPLMSVFGQELLNAGVQTHRRGGHRLEGPGT